jgi:hypothetical protein
MKIRAPGTDNINAELIQTAGPQAYIRFYKLLLNTCNQKGMSNEWYLVLICQINNKEDKSECCTRRRILVVTVVLSRSLNLSNLPAQDLGHVGGNFLSRSFYKGPVHAVPPTVVGLRVASVAV